MLLLSLKSYLSLAEEKQTVQTGKLYKPPKLTDVVKKQPEERQETAKERNERIERQVKQEIITVLFNFSFNNH